MSRRGSADRLISRFPKLAALLTIPAMIDGLARWVRRGFRRGSEYDSEIFSDSASIHMLPDVIATKPASGLRAGSLFLVGHLPPFGFYGKTMALKSLPHSRPRAIGIRSRTLW